MSGRVAVVGGGLAGIAAAVRLADAGAAVTLLEARPQLGGATYSFTRGGLRVDTGQHVFLRCYDDYRGLLDRLGTGGATAVQPRLDMPVLAPGGRRHTLRRSGLPAPLHLAGAVLGYAALPVRSRLRALPAAAALGRLDPDDPALDERSFGGWLAAHGQDPATVERLWGLVSVAALNVVPEQASLGLAARVFRTGLFDRADAGDLGVPLVPLADLHGGPAQRVLTELGVDVRLRARVQAVRRDGDTFVVTTADAELAADAVVVAVPHPRAAELVPADAVPGGTAAWAGLGASPIVNVHVVYADRVTDLPFFAAVDAPPQWVFDRTAPSGLDRGQYLAVSLSAADEHIDRAAREVSADVVEALAALLPPAGRTTVREVFVTRERRATFRPLPGTARLRPAQRTEVRGLALAGAWTDTGLPDTMEGAVRSGNGAADVVSSHLGKIRTDRPDRAENRTVRPSNADLAAVAEERGGRT